MDAIYARQSIDKKDSVSIEGQIDFCKHECNGDPAQYIDKGFSGKNTQRPDFKRLMNDVESGKIQKVVVYRLDRISRSISDFGRIWDTFKEHGVEFVSVNEKFDTTTPVGRAMIYIIMVFAQLERETITQRILDNYRFRSEKGVYMGGNKPLGYTTKKILLDRKKASILEVDPEGDRIVKDIFKRYLEGFNTHQIALMLNRSNILTTKGATWTNNKVWRILKNMTYAENDIDMFEYLTEKGYQIANQIADFDGSRGMCCFFKNKNRNEETKTSEQIACVGLHNPIIPAIDWIAVQRKIEEKSAATVKSTKRSSRSWLAGLLKCDTCKHSFGLRYTKKNGKEYMYYSCRGRTGRGKSTCNNDQWIQAQDLESTVEKLVLNEAEKLLETYTPEEKADNLQVIELKKELAEYNSQINNLLDAIGRGNSQVDKRLTDRISDLDSKCDELQKEINRLTMDTAGRGKSILEVCKRISKTFCDMSIEEKNKAAKQLIKAVWIDEKGDLQPELMV